MSAVPCGALEGRCCSEEAFRIEPLDEPLGARVHGLDATLPLRPEQARALSAALRDRHVLLCYGQHLDDAQLLRFTHCVGRVFEPAGAPVSLLYAEAKPRAGGDVVWLNLADACDLLDAGTAREVGELQLITYNPFLHRLRPAPARR